MARYLERRAPTIFVCIGGLVLLTKTNGKVKKSGKLVVVGTGGRQVGTGATSLIVEGSHVVQ